MASYTSAPPLDAIAIRAHEFTLDPQVIYLNAASVTPLPERARRAAAEYNRRRASVTELRSDDFEPTLHRCRAAAARLIGAQPTEIALVGNTSFGINLAAGGLPLEPGTRVVVSDREFPANVYPWMALAERGIGLEVVPTDPRGCPDEDRLLERLDAGGVSAFALSAVQYASGYRANLAKFGRFCRERGIFFVIDAIQMLGYAPFDVGTVNVDILATGAHKWLLGPFGTGFVYVRADLIPRLDPPVVGWTAMRASEDLDDLLPYEWGFRHDAGKFEVATMPLQDFAAFTQSLDLLAEVGVARIEEHVNHLLDPLISWLGDHPGMELRSDPHPAHRSGIVAFSTPDTAQTFGALRDNGVVCALREGAIRVAPHLYNTHEDIERLIGVLEGTR